MFEILYKEEMARGTIVRIDVAAPEIAKKIQAGQFVILRVNETGERIPLTIADVDRFSGVLTIIFQIVGKTTALLRSLNVGDLIKDIVGPLGKPEKIENFGTIVAVGGGTGIAILHHLCKALKNADNYLIGIIGAREKQMLILEDQMRHICDELVITTDDGSYGIPGFVTNPLEKYLHERHDIERVYAIGPIGMMKNVCNLTKKKGTPTTVSLNPIMLDGSGMCGVCRVTIGGETKFCCIDGPHFDGHKVDFDELLQRKSMYLRQEKESLLFSIR